MTQTLITSHDPKGTHIVGLLEAALNKAKLDEDGAQRVIENGGELQAGLRELLARFSVSDCYAKEVAQSTYRYPGEYTGPAPVRAAVSMIAAKFSLSPVATFEFLDNASSTLSVPNLAEGLFVFPSVDALAVRHFPTVTNSAERYCRAVDMLFAQLVASRTFYSYREGQINPDQLQQEARTLDMLSRIMATQKGDILVVPAQFGLLHRGESIRRARETFKVNEFGLGTFQVGCMALANASRFMRWEQLQTDCAGDKFAPESGGVFSEAPYFSFRGDGLEFHTLDLGGPDESFGSVSGFLPE